LIDKELRRTKSDTPLDSSNAPRPMNPEMVTLFNATLLAFKMSMPSVPTPLPLRTRDFRVTRVVEDPLTVMAGLPDGAVIPPTKSPQLIVTDWVIASVVPVP